MQEIDEVELKAVLEQCEYYDNKQNLQVDLVAACHLLNRARKPKWETFEDWAKYEWETNRVMDDEITAEEVWEATRQ